MNTSVSPLDNKQVRQAIAMAIDKERIIKVATGGLAQPTGVVFPPGLPCYDANQPTWPFDPARAKELLAQAGYPNGLSTTIIASQIRGFAGNRRAGDSEQPEGYRDPG